MTDIKMAIAAMNADSQRWSEVSSSLTTAAGSADSLNVAEWSFPTQTDIDLHGLYGQLQDKVATLLKDGGTEAKEISDELIHVSKILTKADESALESLKGVWDY